MQKLDECPPNCEDRLCPVVLLRMCFCISFAGRVSDPGEFKGMIGLVVLCGGESWGQG